MIRTPLIALFLCLIALSSAFAQQQPGTGVQTTVPTLVNTVTIMPYVTVSLNLGSGQAFPKSSKGLGFGGGLSFDLTDPGQKMGMYFDFAFQDMRTFATDGNCISINDSVLTPANAEHYWQYIAFEPFLKLQTGNARGYFLVGGSFGFAVLSRTTNVAEGRSSYTTWDGTEFGREFRFDLRAGLGVKLADIGARQLILEGRFGYPLTKELVGFANACNNGVLGDWRLISIQANLGLRL